MSDRDLFFPTYEEIKAFAANIAQWPDTFDQLVWLLAEADLKRQTGQQPSVDAIKHLAEQIAANHPPLHELHWLLAERYLYLVKKEQSGQ
jgi:hypothetical protein